MKPSSSTTLYTLGKGILYISEYSDACPVASYSDLGNCPRLDCEVTEEKLDHYSSRSGARVKDKSVILETGYTITFDLDEMSVKNLQIFLKAELAGGGNVLRANQELTKEWIVKFISDNPAGPNETWEFWRVKLSPAGSFSLISDEWSALSFSGEGLADTDCQSNSPYFNVTFCTTSTTSTSTTSSSTTSSSTTTV